MSTENPHRATIRSVLARAALDRPAKVSLLEVGERTSRVRADGSEIEVRLATDHLFEFDSALFAKLSSARDQTERQRLWKEARRFGT